MENEMYSGTVGSAEDEYEVLFKTQNGGYMSAYVYAEGENDAKCQAQRQGIDRNRIKTVTYLGKRKGYGHV